MKWKWSRAMKGVDIFGEMKHLFKGRERDLCNYSDLTKEQLKWILYLYHYLHYHTDIFYRAFGDKEIKSLIGYTGNVKFTLEFYRYKNGESDFDFQYIYYPAFEGHVIFRL